MDWTVKVTDIAIVFSTIAGPILAVWASELRQQRKLVHDRKEWVFRTLMTTRSTPLDREHVMALNNIDFSFPQKKYPQISDAWGLYYSHLNTQREDTPDGYARWDEKAKGLLSNLIHLMAKDLNIPFSKTQIEMPAYYPSGYVFTESQQNELRHLALEVLKNGRPINIRPIVDNEQKYVEQPST